MATLSGGAEIALLPTITIRKATTKVDDEEELGLRLEAILGDVFWHECHRKAHTSFLPTSLPAAACISRVFYYGEITLFRDTREQFTKILTCWNRQIENLRTNYRVSPCFYLFLSRFSYWFEACMYYKATDLNLSPD